MRYEVINDAYSMITEACRVWDEISMSVVDNLVAEFGPRLKLTNENLVPPSPLNA